MENDFRDYYKENIGENRVFALVIYDIIDDKKRTQLSKYLQGYGFRIQRSAFEIVVKDKIYKKMLSGLQQFAEKEDNIRVYKIIGKGQVKNFGKELDEKAEEIIIV